MLSRKSRSRGIKEGLHSLKPQIFTGKGKETDLSNIIIYRMKLQDRL